MNYNPTDWKTGDIITSEGLNNIQNGIANNDIFLVNEIVIENVEQNEYQLSKTFQEIEQASISKMVLLKKQITESFDNIEYQETYFYFLSQVLKNETSAVPYYNLVFSGYSSESSTRSFICYNINDYPVESIAK